MTRYTRDEINIYERLTQKGVNDFWQILVFDWLRHNTLLNLPGLYTLHFDVMVTDLHVPRNCVKKLRDSLTHLQSCGLIRYDKRTSTVWVVGYIEHNFGSTDLGNNNIKSLVRALYPCRRLPFFNDLLDKYPWLKPAFDENPVPNAVQDSVADAVPNAVKNADADSGNIHQSSVIKERKTIPPKPKTIPDELPPEFTRAVQVAHNNAGQKPTPDDWSFWRYLRNEHHDPHRRSFTPWEIVTTIILARRDEFWTKQMGSFVALGNKTPKIGPDDRKSAKGQPIKFVTIFNQFEPELIRIREKARLEQQARERAKAEADADHAITPEQRAKNAAELKRMAQGIGAKA